MARQTNRLPGGNGIAELGKGKVLKKADYRKRVNKMKYALMLTIAASAAVFVAIASLAIVNEGVSTFTSTLLSIKLQYFALALIVIFCGYLLRFPKWEMYLSKLHIKVPRIKSFFIYLSMYSMDLTPGRWGRAVVGYTLNKLTGVRFGRTFPAIVADIFTDFLGFAILSLIAVFFVRQYVLPSIVIVAVLLLPFLFIYHRAPFEFFKKKLSRFRFMASFFQVGDLYFKNNKLLGGRVYLYSMGFTLPAMFLNSIGFYLIILSFGINIGVQYLPIIVFIYTSSLLIGFITGLPATLGVTDAALLGYLIAFLGPLGVTFGLASAITIFFRISTLWFVEGFGFASLVHTFKYWH